MTETALTPLSHGALNRCFGCGQQNRTGLRLKFFVDSEHRIVCRVRIPRRFEGPPGHVHGGIIATLLDEAMSKANRQFGVVAMTRQMEVEYLKPVPLSTPLELTGHRAKAEGRKHYCKSELRDIRGTILARGSAVFIAVDPQMILKLLKRE
ncbi:MAG: PaaI family thioesterase [Silvibacterium sp.]|nr:PaaI family thioesterase [Silvibacterium sp.]